MTGNNSAKHIYRVDKFVVPASALNEFLVRSNTIREVLKRQEGFVRDSYLEQFAGPGEFNIVTIAEWETQAHIEQAKAAVSALLKETGFNPQEMYQRLNIQADLGFYQEIDA